MRDFGVAHATSSVTVTSPRSGRRDNVRGRIGAGGSADGPAGDGSTTSSPDSVLVGSGFSRAAFQQVTVNVSAPSRTPSVFHSGFVKRVAPFTAFAA
jgi:hypothetical protein